MSRENAEKRRIYQRNLVFSKPSQFKAKGWSETVDGYCYEAKKLTKCILRNRRHMKRPYEWSLTINLNVALPPTTVTALWLKTCRTLRKRGIIALWVREPNKKNKVHYHLIIKNPISKNELEQAIEKAMPSRELVPWRKHVQPIKHEWYYCHYITKARISRTDDRYGAKRLLFKAHLQLKKYGTIGAFWEAGRNKEKLWQELRDVERKIADGLAEPNVKRLAKYVYELLNGCVALYKIERSFGHSAADASVQDWIDSLIADEWAEVAG